MVVKAGGPGVRDCFLKDASRGALVAPRGGERGESRLRGLWKETTTVGAARDPPGVVGKGKIAGVVKGWSGERNEYESN